MIMMMLCIRLVGHVPAYLHRVGEEAEAQRVGAALGDACGEVLLLGLLGAVHLLLMVMMVVVVLSTDLVL